MSLKNKKRLFLIGTFILFIGIIFNLSCSKKYSDIDRILKSESYSYLPKAAQNYIKDVYEKTGTIILTEKNKEDNTPYLNPEYVTYLELSENEKQNIALIPDSFVLDYSTNQTDSASSLPSSFDLRNQDGYNFVSPVKNQGATNVCWAFASIENIETLYMKNNTQTYNSLTPEFSIRQMDYITSTNHLVKDADWVTCSGNCSWIPWDNPKNGSREVGTGGNFYVSSIAMANAITLTDEDVLPWHEDSKPVWAKDILDYDKSLYEADSTIIMPMINDDTASPETINSYVSDIKEYMIQYGGPYVGTYSPQSTCGFKNIDGTRALKTDDCVNDASTQYMGHAMQIVGWDDNYQYSYCDAGTNHYDVNNGTCSQGELTTGKGAWIIKNSWGTDTSLGREYSYIYLTYDSTRMSVGFTTSISDMKTRKWDNNYHTNPWIDNSMSNGMINVYNQTIEFNTHNNGSEKIEKIKFIASSKNAEYKISISSGNNNYSNIATVSTTEAGYYTVDLSDKNIILDDKDFSVTVTGENWAYFINNTISIFTSNVNKEPTLETNYLSGIETYEKPSENPSEENIAFVSSTGDTTITLEHYLKNIDDYKKITYKVLLDGEDYSQYFFYDYHLITSNMIYIDGYLNTTLNISKEKYSNIPVCGKTYTFQILYDGKVLESIPLKRICNNWDNNYKDYTKSNIRFHKNDGSGYISTIQKEDTKSITIMNNNGTGNEFIGAEKNFFSYDRYIKSWNTKPDGSGETYTNNPYFVYKDMDFYAQWSDPKTEEHKYKITWECKKGDCNESSPSYQLTWPVFNKEHIVPDNIFTNITPGIEFIYWTFDSEDTENIYYEEEKVINLTENGFTSPYNNAENEYLEAVWSDSYNSVTFNANSGSGTMKGIKIIKGQTSRLKYNLFTREGYTFIGWNTKADGTGTSYIDGQNVSLTKDITLYAQWQNNSQEIKYKITFNSNNGKNDSLEQNITNNTYIKLTKNTFTREGYTFVGWNTKADGTGTSYNDEQVIKVSSDLVLYANWQENDLEITFDANGGIGTMSNFILKKNESKNLPNNTFTRKGYTFKEWNTNANGTGTSYLNKQSISISSNITLYAQWEESYDYKINKYSVDETNKYISKIMVNTDVNTFKSNVNLNNGYGINVDYKTINNRQVLYTGGKTRITYGSTIYSEYTNIVVGDINGDGAINSADLLKIRQHLLRTNTLTGAYFLSSDINCDNTINSADLLRVRQHLLGSKPIE